MLTLHTQSLQKYGLSRIFEFAQKAGYDGLEVGVDPENYDTQNAQYLAELSTRYQLPILALHAPLEASSKNVQHVVEMAVYLKCPMVVVSPPKFLDFKFTNWLKKETPLLRKKKDIQIALINTPGKTLFGFLPEHAMNNLSDLKEFGMVALDCSSSSSKKWGDLMGVYNYLKKLVVHVHLSNIYQFKPYSLPNEGILPLESFLRKLKLNGYEGVLSLRVRPSALQAGEDEKVMENLKRVKEFVDEFYRE